MKKIVLLSLLVFGMVSGYAKENRPYYFYGEVSTVGLIPEAGIGFRLHEKKHGMDLSFVALPISANPVKANLTMYSATGRYLFYPLQDGLNLSVGAGLSRPYDSVSSEPIILGGIGYEWNRKSLPMFVEIKGSFLAKEIKPSFEKREVASPSWWPSLSFGIGY